MLIDLFTYSKATRGGLFGIEALIEAARCAHLDAFCITDREQSAHAYDIQRIAEQFDYFVGIGLEIETSAGTLVIYPEKIDDDFVSEEWREYLGDYPDPQITIDYFKERGAAVVARNIYDQGKGFKDRIFSLNGIDAIDVVSATRRRIDNELALEAQQRLAKPGVGGSGVFDLLDEIGHVATLMRAPSYSQERLVASLCQDDLWPISLRPIGDACPLGAQRDARPMQGRERDYRGSERRGRRDERRTDARKGDRRDRRDNSRRGERSGSRKSQSYRASRPER
ncbi:MAG: hypothetical protein WC966_01325 [Bradymonadales bacterium]|jgi:hypothetical protein